MSFADDDDDDDDDDAAGAYRSDRDGIVLLPSRYPARFTARSGVVSYRVESDVSWSLLPACLPIEARNVIAGLLACNPSERMSLDDALTTLEGMVV